MPRHEEQRVLPYRPEFIFDIVADVGSYPEFLPWCLNARVYRKRKNSFKADLVVGFKMFRESWTSEVTLEKPRKITSIYIKGPMKHLTNIWVFHPHAEGTLVDFLVDFEFKNPFLQKMLGALFEEASHKMMLAFDKRARDLTEGQK